MNEEINVVKFPKNPRLTKHIEDTLFFKQYPLLKNFVEKDEYRRVKNIKLFSEDKIKFICPDCGFIFYFSPLEIANKYKAISTDTFCPRCQKKSMSFPEALLKYVVSDALMGEDIRFNLRFDGFEYDVCILNYAKFNGADVCIEYDGNFVHRQDEKKHRDSVKNEYANMKDKVLYRMRENLPPVEGCNNIIIKKSTNNFSNIKESLDELLKELKVDFTISDEDWKEYLFKASNTTYIRKVVNGKSVAKMYPEIAKQWSSKNKVRPEDVPWSNTLYYKFVCPNCGKEFVNSPKDFKNKTNIYCNIDCYSEYHRNLSKKKIKDYFENNPNSSITQAKEALGMKRDTISMYTRELGIKPRKKTYVPLITYKYNAKTLKEEKIITETYKEVCASEGMYFSSLSRAIISEGETLEDIKKHSIYVLKGYIWSKCQLSYEILSSILEHRELVIHKAI